MKSRILFIFAALILLWSGLILRAVYLQVLPNERLSALHERQSKTVITLNNRRGAVVDRKGRELAVSVSAYSIFADPKRIEHRQRFAKKVGQVLGVNPSALQAKIKDPNKRFTWLARQVSKEVAEKIKALGLKGVAVVEDFKRVYPNEYLLAHSLGMIGIDGEGLEGLELQYNHQLQGNRKKISIKRDARGRPLIADGMMFAENPDGAEVKLTIDLEMQHMLEAELRSSMQEFQAQQAFGIILDVHTSAILAMANTHQFDANSANKFPAEIRRNRLLTDAFEPGSTLKTFVIAGALREKMITPNKKYNTENGTFKIGNRVIHEAESKHAWPELTVSEILAYSSNIGVAKIALEMGEGLLRKTLADFGFGVKTGVDMPGEAKGNLQTLPWNPHLLSNISFGHGVTVTPLQLANAYAAIANGGRLNSPYIVQSIRDPETDETTEVAPKAIRQVLSEQQSASMRLMLAGVTAAGGTGAKAQVEGFVVAGKTGTAQKASSTERGYLKGAYISSFAGFFPAGDPQYVIYIMFDQPSKTSYYGSVVAAPVFSRVASYTARLQGLPPMMLSSKNLMKGERTSTDKVKAKALPESQNLSVREVLRKMSGTDEQIKLVQSDSGQISIITK